MKLTDLIHLEHRKVIGRAIVERVEIVPTEVLCVAGYGGAVVPSWDITYWLKSLKGDVPEGFRISSIRPPHVINLKSEGDRCCIVSPPYLVVGRRRYALGQEDLI